MKLVATLALLTLTACGAHCEYGPRCGYGDFSSLVPIGEQAWRSNDLTVELRQ